MDSRECHGTEHINTGIKYFLWFSAFLRNLCVKGFIIEMKVEEDN